MDLSTLIGKGFDSPEVQAFVKLVGVAPEEDEDFYDFPSAGACLRVEPRSRRIGTIFLYADKVSGYAGYRGALPDGLAFSMDRASIETLFGPPLQRTDKTSKWEKGTHGLGIEFDQAGRIRTVVVTGA